VALQAPAEFVDMYPREWDTEHYLGNRGYVPSARPRATYAAMITYLDHAVGRLRDAIEAAGALDNTLILFTSDNGTTYAGGVDSEFFGSLGTLRGHKTNLYEGGIRVPMLAWWPGRIDPLRRTDVVAQLPDLYPTILDAVGGRPSPGSPG
jgi:arylsulfatase A